VTAPPPRPRTTTGTLLAATIVAGLASRAFAAWQPDVVARFGGDVLWAAMVFWILALVRPRGRTLRLGLTALAIATAVELSQLHQAPWIETLRQSRLGALALGRGFLWSDLVCYALGVGLAMVVDMMLRRGQRSAHHSR
jgi:hypothetical protein